jgi:tetratricopeptide (TPR) repeat protein
LHDVGKRLRNKLGESMASIQKYDTPLERATTHSLEALRAYSLATRTFRSKGETAALPLFKHVIDLDPDFALAYSDLSIVYSNLHEDDLSMEYAKKAFERRENVSEWEKHSIDWTYFQSVTGELDKASQANEEWKQEYPLSLAPYVNLGLIDSYQGRLQQALEDDLEALRVKPDIARVYSNLSFDYMSLDRLSEADATLAQARGKKLDDSMLLNYYQLAFLRDDPAEMARQSSAAVGRAGVEDALLASQSDTEGFRGRLKQARELSRRAAASSLHADEKEIGATWLADAALREAEFGNTAETVRQAREAMALASTREVQIAASLALARVGEIRRAQSMAGNLERRFPNDTLLVNYWLPCIRAAVALRERQATKAIDYLRPALPYELGGGVPPFSSGATLYPAYLRGQAYLANRQWDLSAAEFQKIVDHRGLVWNFPLGALARLQLGRAYAALGNDAKARIEYQDFLDLWKDADPDIPAFRAAQMEYSRLH